jgi:4-amino-4-deoxy-L-arabinose transferase-like glycosyltransferase
MNGNLARQALETGHFKVFYPEDNGNEGLYINVTALFVELFGSTRFALRITSAIFGIITIGGIGLLGSELFSEPIGLLAAFFTATSFWHLNFSRIATHAIAAPCFLVWSMWLLLVAIRRRQEGRAWWVVMLLAGLTYGLGVHTYLPYRVTPVLMAGVWLYEFGRARRDQWLRQYGKCFALFWAMAILAAAPLLIHFLREPADMSARSAQLSLLRSDHPGSELISNVVKTAGMLFVDGDANWRHNYDRRPELFLPVALLFLAGLLLAALQVRTDSSLPDALVIGWLLLGAVPEVLSTEGIPHAYRAILMIPPIFYLAAIGAHHAYFWLSEIAPLRVCSGVAVCFLLVVAYVPVHTYFGLWASDVRVREAFGEPITREADYINAMPREAPKDVVTDAQLLQHGIPLWAQPIAFLTHSYTPEEQHETHIHYINPNDFPKAERERFNATDYCRVVEKRAPGDIVICLTSR